MESAPRTAYVGDIKSGDLWKLSEWRKIVTGKGSKGSLLRIFNATPSSNSKASSSFVRPVPFSCLASSKEMPFGNIKTTLNSSEILNNSTDSFDSSFAFVVCAVDQRGHLFAFDVCKNKFWLVARSGVSATCMAFNSVRRREVIIGLSDNSIHCYNIDTNQLVARLPAYHRSEPVAISVHPNKPIAISNSRSESIIWDTEKWERKRVLMGAGPGVQQASFSYTGDSIVTAFNDGTILIWDSETFNLRWKISLERFAPNLKDGSTLGNDDDNDFRSKLMLIPRTCYFSVSANDELLVYGGLSASIYVWNLTEKRLMHEILIPAFKKRIIAQIEFIGNTNIVAALSSGGELIFIDTEGARMLGQFKGKHLFRSFTLSHDGTVMSVVLMDAKYSVRMLRIDTMIKLRPRQTEDELDEGDEKLDTLEFGNPSPSPPGSPAKRVKLQNEHTKTFYEMIEAKEDTTILNRRKLLKYLKHYGSYPEDYRTMIWRFLLKLPENREAYDTLLEKSIHPSVKEFRKKFPLKSDRLAKSIEKILSGLAHWSPIFEDLDYLPGMVFPVVKLFINDAFSGFEVTMTLLTNWCQKWWEYYPNPPIECLGVLEDLLAYHDPELLAHFTRHKITSQVYGWGLMQSFFTEIVSKSDWLKVWDHMVTNPPAYMYYFITSYLLTSRTSLLATRTLEDYQYFLTRVNAISIDKVIVTAYKLHSRTPDSCSPVTFFQPFTPLLRGQYEIFNKYPEFIVNYQSKMKEKIRADEVDYLRRRKMADDVAQLTDDLKKDKKAWETADWKMNEMVEKWWENMMGAEDSHNERISRLDALEKEQRARALRRIAEARKSFVDHQSNAAKLHALSLAKVVGANRRDFESRLDKETIDTKFKQVENEWLARREEMMSAREELARLDHTRAERLVGHAKTVGVPSTAYDVDLDQVTRGPGDSVNAPETQRLRDALKQGFRDPSLSPTRIRPRTWSPELVEERRHRRAEQMRFVDVSDMDDYDDGRSREQSPVRSDKKFVDNLAQDLFGSPARSVTFQ
ncbi:UNVERIFIED_CONTAM: TBC1 domain member 31 [Siphonaria sp. JEL0065]|nr:TBC1 domain member 31 [Siphonaria sp. JEL0065]